MIFNLLWVQVGQAPVIMFSTVNNTVEVRVNVPLRPVIVSVKVPVGVEPIVERFKTAEPEPPIVDGLKDPVTPPGSPETLIVTVPEKPLIGVTVVRYVIPLPAVTNCEPGDDDIEKSGVPPPLTVKTAVVVRDGKPAAAPVTIIVKVPLVVPVVKISIVETPDPVIDAGIKFAVVPEGNPLALRATKLLKPLRPFTPIVKRATAPAEIVSDGGVVVMAKSALPPVMSWLQTVFDPVPAQIPNEFN